MPHLATKRGWKLTLPSSGERIVAQASIRYGKAIVSTLIPNTALCRSAAIPELH